MARRRIERGDYEAMVVAFREHGPKTTVVGRIVGFDKRTVRKAWVEGWPEKGADWGPIRLLVKDEQRAARADLVAEGAKKLAAAKTQVEVRQAEAALTRAYAEAEKARKDAIAARRAEAEIVRGERANVMGLIAATGVALRGAMDQAASIEAALRTGIDPATKKPIPLLAKVKILAELGRLVRLAGETAMDVVRVERLLLGEPTEIVGTRNLDNLTEDDAIRELERAGEVAARMKERRARRLKLIQGGKSNGAGSNGSATTP